MRKRNKLLRDFFDSKIENKIREWQFTEIQMLVVVLSA